MVTTTNLQRHSYSVPPVIPITSSVCSGFPTSGGQIRCPQCGSGCTDDDDTVDEYGEPKPADRDDAAADRDDAVAPRKTLLGPGTVGLLVVTGRISWQPSWGVDGVASDASWIRQSLKLNHEQGGRHTHGEGGRLASISSSCSCSLFRVKEKRRFRQRARLVGRGKTAFPMCLKISRW